MSSAVRICSHGFGIFAPLREFGAQQVTQLGVAGFAHDGGT